MEIVLLRYIVACAMAVIFSSSGLLAQTQQTQSVYTVTPPTWSVVENWFGAGQLTNVWDQTVFATVDSTKPTVRSICEVDHQVGGANPYQIFAQCGFSAVVGRAAGGNVYGYNTVCHADTGFNKLMQCYEIDLNNYSGFPPGEPEASNAIHGITFAGSSGPTGVDGAVTDFLFFVGPHGMHASRYGLSFSQKAAKEALIYDYSDANQIIRSMGTHQQAFSLHTASFSSGWATVPNNTPLFGLGAGGATFVNIAKLDNTDAVVVGDATHAVRVPGGVIINGRNVNGVWQSWTPTMSCANGAAPSLAGGRSSWVQSDDGVKASFYFNVTALNGCSGAIKINGLPIASTGDVDERGYVGLTNYQGINAGAGQTQISGFIKPNSTSITLVSGSATGAPAVEITGEMLNVAAPIVLQGMAFYH